MASLALLGGVIPLRGDSALGFISSSFARILDAWGGAPERGVPLSQMSRWGDTPLFPPPRGETNNPQRGGNGRDPHNETPPKRREGGHVYNIALEITCRLEARFNRVLLGGVVIIEGDAYKLGTQGRLYEPINDVKLAIRPIKFKAIPYYAWANREPGPMTVWVPLMDYYDKVVKTS